MATAKGVASRERMLDAAIGLMRHGGLAAAGMNEIVAASGAPKGSVYHHFPDGKRQLAAEALDRYAGRIHALFDASLAGARRPGDKVRALFRMLERRLEEADFGQSCAVGAVTLDLDEDLETVRLAATAAQFAPALVVVKELEGYLRGREPGEVPGILRAALLRAGLPGEAVTMQSTELDAVRCALEWGRPGDVLALPVHGLAARAAVLDLLQS